MKIKQKLLTTLVFCLVFIFNKTEIIAAEPVDCFGYVYERVCNDGLKDDGCVCYTDSQCHGYCNNGCGWNVSCYGTCTAGDDTTKVYKSLWELYEADPDQCPVDCGDLSNNFLSPYEPYRDCEIGNNVYARCNMDKCYHYTFELCKIGSYWGRLCAITCCVKWPTTNFECLRDSACSSCEYCNIWNGGSACTINPAKKVDGSDAACGSAGAPIGSTHKMVCSKPTTNLCADGDRPTVSTLVANGETYYTWVCAGNAGTCGGASGSSISCFAYQKEPTDGGWSGWSTCSSCSQSRTCTDPSPACGGSDCAGSDTRACGLVNGVDGECGSANGGVFESTPPSNQLCIEWNPIWIDQNAVLGEYRWNCSATNGRCGGSDGTPDSCQAIRVVDPWFQVKGGGVVGAKRVINSIPTTCTVDVGCTVATSVFKGNNNNGVVAATSSRLCGGNGCKFGQPNNWEIEADLTDGRFSYDYFYNNYFLKFGLGTTTTSWDKIGTSGVYFVNGNLNIDSSNDLANGKFLMIISNGTVNITQSTNKFNGILVAKNINIDGSSATQLNVNGILYSYGGNVNISRGYINKVDNNNSPAVVVNYDPGLIFLMPGVLINPLTSWKQGF